MPATPWTLVRLDILKGRSFRNIWAASVFSSTGTEISRLAIFLHLFNETDSVVALATFIAFRTVPGVLVAPVAGCLIDRFDKRSMMVACELTRFGLILAILVHPTESTIYGSAVLDSLVATLFEPAKKTSIALVVEKSGIAKANGLDQSASNLTMIIGPVIGAELFIQTGLAVTLSIDAASYLIGAWLIGRTTIPNKERLMGARPWSVSSEISDGWRYLVQHNFVVRIVLLLFVSIICGGMWVPLAPFFIRDVLRTEAAMLGWQISAFGFGGVVGGLLVPNLTNRIDQGALLVWSCLAEALHMALYSVIRASALSTVIIFSWGITVAVIGVCSHSILQVRVKQQYLGRVFSILKQSENSAMLLSMLLATTLGTAGSAQLILLVAGLSYFCIVAVSATTSQEFLRMQV